MTGLNPEAIYQDADVEQAEAYAVGALVDAKLEADVCLHLSAQGPEDGPQRCIDGCGRMFDSWEALLEASDAALYG